MASEADNLLLEVAFLRAELSLAKTGVFEGLPQDLHDAFLRKARDAVLSSMPDGEYRLEPFSVEQLSELRVSKNDLNGHEGSNARRLLRLLREGVISPTLRGSTWETPYYTVRADTGILLLYKAREYWKEKEGMEVSKSKRLSKVIDKIVSNK